MLNKDKHTFISFKNPFTNSLYCENGMESKLFRVFNVLITRKVRVNLNKIHEKNTLRK